MSFISPVTSPVAPHAVIPEMTPCIRIVLADDHQLLRAGLRLLLAGLPGVEIVGEAGDGIEVLALCDAVRPDIVLMDIAMPNMNGLDALEVIRQRGLARHVIILSMLASEEHVLRALSLGAAGYVLKDAAPAELELAISAVMRGESWLSPPVSRQVVDAYLTRVSDPAKAAAGDPVSLLTPRQQEVLRLVAEGKSTKEVAFALDLSVKTIETYRTQIMEKLGLHDIPGLVRYAIRQGIIPLGE
jgi:DNA-binding NarL/FixJ family response regulator